MSSRAKRGICSSSSLTLRVGGIPHLAYRMRLRHQPLQVVDEAFARVLRVFVVPPDVNRLLGADFLTVAAEDATELIDLEHQWIAVPLLIFAGHQLDAVRRT